MTTSAGDDARQAGRVGLADRIAGALLGVHAGDSLGATLEFSSWSSISATYPAGLREIIGGGPFDWPPGHATDDTDLTRAVLLAYLDAVQSSTGEFDVVTSAADHMLRWLDGDWPGRTAGIPPRDVGGATRAGLLRYRDSRDPRRSGAGPGKAGNGSLMRCIPTALAVADRAERIADSIAISAITHDDPRATIACAAYNEIAAALVAGARPAEAVDAGLSTVSQLSDASQLGAAGQFSAIEVAAAITAGRGLQPAVLATTGAMPLPGGASGYVLDSLSLAVAAALDPRPLPDVLVDIARLGNDTDTNAAIAGGLLGARNGAAAIPDRWIAMLQFGAEFTAAADQLAARFSSGADQTGTAR